tara:strand:- start:13458 stop:13670 length:213 start_codon:yes stop_codon:yes gene_type:complete
MFKYLLLKSISFYKVFLSPYLGGNCKYEPSCSNYSYGAIKKYGALRGTYLTLVRLARCNPFSSGGYDPIN